MAGTAEPWQSSGLTQHMISCPQLPQPQPTTSSCPSLESLGSGGAPIMLSWADPERESS